MHRRRHVTWLDLVRIRYIAARSAQIRVHRHEGRVDSFALTIDGVPLVDTSGTLTTFRTRQALERFLGIIGITGYELVVSDFRRLPLATGQL